MKILIVDDNAADRTLLRYNLEHHGCEVIEASDGAEGLHLASINQPDLIVSDALMPVMDGFQFLRVAKNDVTLSLIPFVFYSAIYTGREEVEFALSLGADAFIIKPTDPDEFWTELNRIINAKILQETQPTLATPIDDEHDYLQRYSNIVATKLEEKVKELETANTKILESEQFIKNIVESVDEGIVVIDPNYRILSTNRAYLLFCKKPPDDILGKHCFECSHGSLQPCYEKGIYCPVKETFETGSAATTSHTHFDNKGDSSLYEVRSFPMKNTLGEVTAVIKTTRDITEKTKLEDQLRQSQKMESIGTLAGGIAHDFNNILTAIMGYGEIALMGMAKDDPQRSNIEIMLQGADRAAHLTKDLLLFSRKQKSLRKTTDLNNIIRQVEKFLKKVIGEDITCTFILHDQPILINGDSHHLEQVLMNFATNARDAMPQGGSFTVTTEQIQLNKEFIATHAYGKTTASYAVITVTDTGSGITKETQQRIFEPFFTTKEVGKGTGLGMAVVYGIIHQHEGYITLDSEPGRGTTFKIYLPVVKSAVKKEPLITPNTAMSTGTETILLAEDDESVRKLQSHVLTQSGYTVIEAIDGEDAERKFVENKDRIQLLLFDFLLPKMNGNEAYEKIRALKPGIKVLFVSGYEPDHIQQNIRGMSQSQIIHKPVSPSELLQKVRSRLDETPP